MKYSIIIPCEKGRIDLVSKTIHAYDMLCNLDATEFLFISRTMENHDLDEILQQADRIQGISARLINYSFKGPEYNGKEVFNPSLALNLGVKYSKYNNIIITCPEVKPVTNVLEQFARMGRGNYVAQVWDMNEDGTRGISLVNSNFRGTHPGFYFLACYKKEDIELINGWDLNYMYGQAYDDDSFGERFKRAGLDFKICDDIHAEHQYHGRPFGIENEYHHKNRQLLLNERQNNITRVENGLQEVEEFLR